MTREHELLETFVRRLRQEPDFMGHVLHIYMEQEQIDEQQLAAQLRIAVTAFIRLGTCRTPRLDSEHFGVDVQRIAAFVGADTTELARVIRSTTAIAALRDAPAPSQASSPTSSSAPSLWPGFLAAARDRESGEDDTVDDNAAPPTDEES